MTWLYLYYLFILIIIVDINQKKKKDSRDMVISLKFYVLIKKLKHKNLDHEWFYLSCYINQVDCQKKKKRKEKKIDLETFLKSFLSFLKMFIYFLVSRML